jgi:hypothetical protein
MKKQRQRIGLMNFDAVLTEDQEDMVGKMETLKYCVGLQYNTRVRSLGWGRGRASCSWIGESVDVPVGTRLDAPQRAPNTTKFAGHNHLPLQTVVSRQDAG